MQFWPTHKTASKMLHHTGRFKIRRMVQARLFRKNNPDAHYANAVYKFMRQRAMKNRQNVAFFSADAKCKVSIGEPGYPIAAVSRGKKVVVGENERFMVTDHDFSKLSIIPDAYLLHDIPDEIEDTPEYSSRIGEWYTGQVFYGFKSMVSEGSSAIRCTAEIADVMSKDGSEIRPCLYVYSDGGPERKTDNLSVQKSYTSPPYF